MKKQNCEYYVCTSITREKTNFHTFFVDIIKNTLFAIYPWDGLADADCDI